MLNQSEIIRALLDGLIDSGVDITRSASVADLRARRTPTEYCYRLTRRILPVCRIRSIPFFDVKICASHDPEYERDPRRRESIVR